jgi:hypothetical protein
MLLPLVLFYQKHMEQRGAIMWSQQNQIRERTQPSNELIRDGAKLMQLLILLSMLKNCTLHFLKFKTV